MVLGGGGDGGYSQATRGAKEAQGGETEGERLDN